MSSIYQAVASDLRGNRPSRGNPIVQNDRSFRDDGNINADIEQQRQQEAFMRKQLRMEEGGRAGGYNDRQTIATKEHKAVEAADGYDDFGRRITNRAGDKKQRAQAALDRLRGAKAGRISRARERRLLSLVLPLFSGIPDLPYYLQLPGFEAVGLQAPSLSGMGCQTSKAAPVEVEKAPIAVTEAPADSKTSTEAPAAEPLPPQDISPSAQEKAEELKDSVVQPSEVMEAAPAVEESLAEVKEVKEEVKEQELKHEAKDAVVEAVAEAAEAAKEIKEEVAKAEVKEDVAEVSAKIKAERKEFQAEVADGPKVIDAALPGEARTATCDLFGMCGP
ncbi:unnamed protein product [Symbiodinium natans]|uniref:Uncharacterized protein n=1 Tax=Symbiodinium natans TaxID=878477 RepID=A0A812NG69_9DINO|nr:unnamed protein product [Symbiodinium natans]